MSSKRRRPADKQAIVPPDGVTVAAAAEDRPDTRLSLQWWAILTGIAIALVLAFQVYSPALNGEFLFDDDYLPFLMPDVQQAPLRAWLGVRPVLMLSYWLNYQQSGLESWSYHAVSVVLHALNAVLVWIILRRLLNNAGESGSLRGILALFGGALFLLHPVQTESVAYVASRSETLSVFFFLAAYAVYVYCPTEKISIGRTAGVLILFLIACSVKEHTTVLPGLLLLTDYFVTTPFRFDGIRNRLRLYLPILIAGILGGIAVVRVLSTAQTAGFRVQEFTWYEYLLTQFRVIPKYLQLYVFPAALNGDYDFAISRSLVDHGAILWLGVLIAITVFAWMYRRRYPLAAFGWFGFLLLLSPTSSVVPIRDVIAERRLYLPFLCLLLITIEFLRRVRIQPVMLASALGVVLVIASFATYQRNEVWSTALTFWEDTAAKSPNNARAQFQLAYAQWKAGRCAEAADNYAKVAKLQKPDDRLLIDWALALDCLDKPEEAVSKLRQAAAMAPSALIYAQIGMVYGKRGKLDEATTALEQAEKLDPHFEMTYVYRGNVQAARQDYNSAVGWYRRALSINPRNEPAQNGLAIAERNLKQVR